MEPVTLAREIEARYQRYLNTTFYFLDSALRASFKEALEAVGHLSKGPYLEATHVFKRGRTTKELFEELLGRQADEGFLGSMERDRPLYSHQEEAIRRVYDGHNVAVATGTASGKTEAFLYPIILHLYREFLSNTLGPGVRAVVLYPMNALANDQRRRLGEICRRLKEENSPFRFTFGQYIGETPKDENDSWRHARDHLAERLPNELVLRSEMWEAPPHILLTNYSMLEYLLLRPDDSPLFDNGRARWWTFLILDEAHQYRGSKGIEMGMLIRRLKQRLREGGRSEAFRCIATSATLIGGAEDKAAVAKFATALFGETFGSDDVVLGELDTIPVSSGARGLSRNDYRFLLELLDPDRPRDSEPGLSELCRQVGLSVGGKEQVVDIIANILERDERSTRLRQCIMSAAKHVREVATEVFRELPEQEQMSALSELVDLLSRVRGPISRNPLLAIRYHFFLRSLEGAFISYWPRKGIFLERAGGGERGSLFEVALCRECGQHYLVGKFKNEKLQEAIRDPGDPEFGATFFRPLEPGSNRTDGDSELERKTKSFYLCVQCGAMSAMKKNHDRLSCAHDNFIVLEEQEGAGEREDQIPRCSACGYQAPDPVREVVHGADGPHVVIATTLYQALPAQRKKILAFADGRQEAAFFAWYLQRSYQDILHRNLILKVVRQANPYTSEGLSLRDVARALRELYRKENVFPPTVGDLELGREGWLNAYRELLTDEPRISLEGVGLVRWSIKRPEWFRLPEVLVRHPWELTETDAWKLIFVLLDFMRIDNKAVELSTDPGFSLSWSDLGLQASQKRVRVGPPRGHHWIVSWEGERGKRAQFLKKLLVRRGVPAREAQEQAVECLGHIWETIRQCEESTPQSHRVLLAVEDARRLNPDWWRVFPIKDDETVFQCDTCGRIQTVSVQEVCPRHRCPGTLKETRPNNFEPNHYRVLYGEDLPGALRVEEHTAQIDKERAREVQRLFQKGEIHVLSSSTTFELGVDLGDLDTIFLRNVPPEVFNYVQRVGRAGRMSGRPGFAITYCRRGPHDLYHFADPTRMVKGVIRPPVLSLLNEKIVARHVAAAVLSRFLRAFPDRFESIEKLFNDLERPQGLDDFRTFLGDHRGEFEESLKEIVPAEILHEVGLDNGQWMEKIAGSDSRFAMAELEVSSDFRSVRKLQRDAAERANYATAQWAKARAETIAEEDVLSFLSRKAVIPKYGFPVDVVELDPQRTKRNAESMGVSLQRDLAIAIAEFAPTSAVVANKRLWTSYGLKRVAEREWERRSYRKCTKHNFFISWREGEPLSSEKCCGSATDGVYFVPQFGFITGRGGPREPTRRPARVFSTRPFFAGLNVTEPDKIDFQAVSLTRACPGRMVVLCEGRRGEGFYICKECGAGFRGRENPHEDPYGESCQGTLEQVSLGHELVTDVIRFKFNLQPSHKHIEPVWFAYSLAYALVEGAAEGLDVPSVDLSVTVAYAAEEGIPPIVLYDNVPGGAGLVARLEEKVVLRRCLATASGRVSGGCGCREDESCYGCLRSYRNQFAHQKLMRGPVAQYLERVLAKLS